MNMDNPFMAFLFVFLFFLAPVLLSAIPFLFFYIVYVVSARTVDPVDTVPVSPDTTTEMARAAGAGAFQVAGYVRMAGGYLSGENAVSWQPQMRGGVDAMKIGGVAARSVWTSSGPGGGPLALMETSTRISGRSNTGFPGSL